MQTLKFDVNGITCGGCTGSVRRALAKIDGVSQVNVSLHPGMASMEADPGPVTPNLIEAVISNLGYQAKLRPSDAMQGAKS